MKQELVNGFVEKLNANMGTIENVIKDNLGVETKFNVVVSGRYEKYVNLEEDGHDTTMQLTATPLLAQLFKEAQLSVRCWYHEDENTASFSVDVFYNHNFGGGSNGHKLMMFDMNMENGEVTAMAK